MTSMFWVKKDQLDAEQREAVESIPETASFLLTGPAGSGKTNILLLRAKWLALKRQSNFKIVLFTSSLRKFVEAGCDNYGIPRESATTQMAFFKNILREYGVSFETSGDFELDRGLIAGKVKSLIDSGAIKDTYIGTLLVDEAQDYTDTELMVFRGLTKRLVLASDTRQSIYKATHTPGLPERLVENHVVRLRYHYRSGLKLCKVADGILADGASYQSVQGGCMYPETTLPSSVVANRYESLEMQVTTILENVEPQMDLYPEEKVGVLFPKREQAEMFRSRVAASKLGKYADRIVVDTLHGAKGWEFRAVHLGACETLYRMGSVQKRLIYTGILRGKTSVHLYYSGHLPGYLDAALAVLEPPPPSPTFDDLF